MPDYYDPVEAARRRMMPQTTAQSFFPAVNQRLFSERSDLLKDADDAFYGGGNAPPPPTPTPTPAPRSYFGGGQFPQFQPTAFQMPPRQMFNFGLGQPNRSNPWEDWQKRYGFGFTV